jgi:hypothetical protein
MSSINISVSINYKNDKLNNILSKKDIIINESILNYGLILYENQGNILNELSKDKEVVKLKEELKENKIKYDEMIKKINDEKMKDMENIYIEKQELERKIRDTYSKREKEYETMINNIENEKISQRDSYCKTMNEIENKIKTDYQDKIKYLETDINKLKNEKTLEISSLIEKGKQITKEEYEKIIDLHKTLNNDLKEKNNNLDKVIIQLQSNVQDLNNKLINFNKQNENYNYESINGNINNLNEKFSNYFDKIFKGNTEKGNFGEDFIESYLTDKFTNSKIIDTHKETAKGDFMFIFDKLKTLIESKNVQILKKEDVDKFYRDIEIRVSKNEINSALLISLNDTNLINGKRHFHFEIKNNIPIIMISNTFNNIEFIRFSILILNYLIKNGFANNESNDDKIYFIINSLNEIFDIFKMQLSYLQNDKHFLLKLEDSFKKRETDLYNIDKLFKNIFSKYPDVSINSLNTINPEDTFNNIIEKIKIKIDEEPNFNITIKNLEELDISQNTIKKIGGIRKITDFFKKNKMLVI